MTRTKRNIPYKHYWGETKQELKRRIDRDEVNTRFGHTTWYDKYRKSLERDYLLHGTDARNHSVGTHEYFNHANRVGRRIARDQLRPHFVASEDYDFDDSHYRRKYKGVWWEIY